MTLSMYIIRSNKLKATLITSGYLAIFAIGWADYKSGLELGFSIFYLLPIIIITWATNMWIGIPASLLSAIIWSTADRLGGHVYSYEWIPYWNAFVRFGFYIIITITLSRLKEGMRQRSLLYEELEEAYNELKKAEEDLELKAKELVRSNVELEQFAYVAAHDLRYPLVTIGGYINMLKRKYKDKLDEEAMELISTASRGVYRMETLIKGLLSYARLESKVREFELTDMNENFRIALSNLQDLINESNAEITCDPLTSVMADDVQMVQVFQNLVGNAIRFVNADKERPRIHVSVKKSDEECVFSIMDNGIGIGAEHFERIFGLFQRIKGAGENTGTGIGLAICKKIVELHGGRIWVESEPGKGSVLYFTIPAAKHPEVAA